MQDSTGDTHPISNSITNFCDHRPSSWPCSLTWVTLRQRLSLQPLTQPLLTHLWNGDQKFSSTSSGSLYLTHADLWDLRWRPCPLSQGFPRFRTGLYQAQLSTENVHAEVETSLIPNWFFNAFYNEASVFWLRKVCEHIYCNISRLNIFPGRESDCLKGD